MTRDSWPAVLLFLMGSCSYALGRAGKDASHPDAGALPLFIGVFVTPIAASFAVMLLRSPRNLMLRLLIALGTGAAVLALMFWV